MWKLHIQSEDQNWTILRGKLCTYFWKQSLFCWESACSILSQINLTMVGEFHYWSPNVFLFSMLKLSKHHFLHAHCLASVVVLYPNLPDGPDSQKTIFNSNFSVMYYLSDMHQAAPCDIVLPGSMACKGELREIPSFAIFWHLYSVYTLRRKYE